ncbi:MAG: hypothetical protein IPN42_04050 [Methylococcaceae bacterium]|nr:hypothetical protein [Methylococcaceae bacterium]
MSFSKLVTLALGLLCGIAGYTDVSASTISVKCEVRSSPARSKISVDGAGVAGKFYAQVKSGGVLKSTGVKSSDSANEVEFDLDSNPADIKAGATAISASFIKNKYVIGYIRRSGTNGLIAAASATCAAK